MSHTPRGPRKAGRFGRSGTVPPVPGRPTSRAARTAAAPPLSPVPVLLACLLCCAALALSTWQVRAHGPLFSADERLGDALRTAAPPRGLAELLADLGNMEVALPALAAATALAFLRAGAHTWWPALCYAVTLGVTAAAVSALKVWTDRAGPLGGTGFYPSGHAATTAVALGGAALLLAHHLPYRAALFLWTVLALLTVGNGLGLVWRGYHWPLDVAASWCLSVLLLSSAAAAARRTPPLPRPRPEAAQERE